MDSRPALVSPQAFGDWPQRLLDPAVAVAQRFCPAGLIQLNSGMPQNFIGCDRDQAFLLPPSLRDWLPADHLAWFVIETVDQLDLDVFYFDYRVHGHGRARMTRR